MTYVLELKPEVARAIESRAAGQGLTAEEFLAGFIECTTQSKVIPKDEFRRIVDEIHTKHAKVFEALAQSERNEANVPREL